MRKVFNSHSGQFVKGDPRCGFKPGKSGNPNGSSPVAKEIRNLARSYCAEAVHTLASMLRDASAKKTDRIYASNSLLDRGLGKPVQQVEGDVSVLHSLIYLSQPSTIESLEGKYATKLLELNEAPELSITAPKDIS